MVTRPRWHSLAFTLWLIVGLLGCSGDEGAETLAECAADDECRGGVCIDSRHDVEGSFYCSEECSAPGDCPLVTGVQLVCASTSAGSVCSRPCTGDVLGQSSYDDPKPCVDGTPTECAALSPQEASRHCEACGCASSERCTLDGCAPKLVPGEPCTEDDECASANCGAPGSDAQGAMRCLVAFGAPCTADDCLGCHLHGQSLCTAPCTSDGLCPIGWHCIGSETSEGWRGSCQPPCYNGTPFGSEANCPAGQRCALEGDVSWCAQ